MTGTIFALATPPGKSGVAVIRVSGPEAFTSLHALTGKKPKARTSALLKLRHPDSRETIDRALVLTFENPASFTGEDVAEYHVHGGRAIINSLLEALAAQPDHRMAEPGEFTRRAFDNGKLDLTEAEALADLINAETQMQKTQALAQMEGSLSRLYTGWGDILKKILAHIEADLEFPDEDLPEGLWPQLSPQIEQLLSSIQTHLADSRRGERLRDGIQIAVIGAPNAGKSSLVNALAQRDVAIVSSLAGTTRDVIEAHLDLGGYAVTIADTAGLRPEALIGDGHESIENEGMRRALLRAQNADLKILLFDGSADEADSTTQNLIDENSIVVINKADKGAPQYSLPPALLISAETGAGMDKLIAALLDQIRDLIGATETPSITRARYRENLQKCLECLNRALYARLPELTAEDLRLAIRALGRITGRVSPEDLLDVIFRDFCIGK